MLDIFPASPIKPDGDGYRTCGSCGERKSVSEFYKDGKDGDGNPKYRRDCKECYRIGRLKSRKAKRSKPIEVAPRRRKKK